METFHRQVYIGCPLKLSRYLASFPRYLAPKLRQILLRDDVISDVIKPGSTIRENHIDTHIGKHCVQVSSNSDKNWWRRSIFKKKKRYVTIITSSGHVTSSGACAIDSKFLSLAVHWNHPARYLASFPRYLVPKLPQWLYVIRPGSTIRGDHIDIRVTHHIGKHCVQVSSNSGKNCRRRSIFTKKKRYVSIMTSSSHVTSSGACAIDSP